LPAFWLAARSEEESASPSPPRRGLLVWESENKDKSVGELQCEAINLLFAKHGLPPIAVRWTPGD
jgi:hypothetical protein